MTFLSAAERHDFLSTNDPEYRCAHNWRRGGTALAGIGGAIGSLVGLISIGDVLSDDKTGSIAGLVIVVASLAVGLPIAFRADSRMRAIRSRYPTLSGGARRRSGSVQLEWDY